MIPDETRRFLLTSIPSVPYLEAALLFRRMPDAQLTRADLAHALYIDDQRAANLLDGLLGAQIIQAIAGNELRYRYAPRDEGLAAALEQLARVYETEMIAVANLIHDTTAKSAQHFADAFRLRRKGP